MTYWSFINSLLIRGLTRGIEGIMINLFFRIRTVILCIISFGIIVLLFPKNSFGLDSFAYQVERNGSNVGNGLISIDHIGDKTLINYRMHIDVKILFVTFYLLDSQQIALFDKSANLIFAKTKADIDGEQHEVEVRLVKGNYEVLHNGVLKKVKQGEFLSTTLHPVFSKPISGMWLDLTNAKIVPYKVTNQNSHYFLERPDGSDKMFLDANGFLDNIESKVEKGELLLRRIAVGEQATKAVALPELVKVDKEIDAIAGAVPPS